MSRFSERHGYKSVREAVQRESIDEALRNALWTAVDLYFCTMLRVGGTVPMLGSETRAVIFRLWTKHFRLAWDDVSRKYLTDVIDRLRRVFYECEWYEVYDLLEFFAEELPGDSSREFVHFTNEMLERETSAYQLVGGRIAEITSQQEIEAVEAALVESEPFGVVRSHLERSLELYSERPEPDYRNSVKESISAVESLACLIADDPKATLGKALDKIEKQGKMELHRALRKAFDVLYGYTSDEDGIRHKMLEEGNVGRAEALYMLVACSAFVSYLISKAADAGMDLTTG